MIWSARPFYGVAMLLASLSPILAARMERAPSAPAVVSDRLGLTLGEDARHRVVVTSLRSGGLAERGGIMVGDEVTAMADRPVTALATARKFAHASGPCAMALSLYRHGIPYRTIIWQCGNSGIGEKDRFHGSQDFAGRR